MKQWDIWTCDFADAGPHPAVIVSHPDRVARAPLVNVLIGSSQRATRQWVSGVGPEQHLAIEAAEFGQGVSGCACSRFSPGHFCF